MISNIKSTFKDIAIDFHGHNDLGMATANSISAVQGGVDSLSVTVNGVGERSGNAPLEEVVMALKYSLGVDCDIKTENFTNLSKMVSEYSGIIVSPNKPIVGKNIFKHESGIHCKGMIFDKNSYELFHPEEVGAKEEEFVIGKHTGSSTIKHLLKKNGITLEENYIKKLVENVKLLSHKEKRVIQIDELLSMCEKLYCKLK